MPTTQQLRDAWSPACQKQHRANIHEAHKVLDTIFKKYNYKPIEGQTWGHNCRKITGGSGYSLHSYRSDETFTFWTGVKVTIAIAVDVNSVANPYGPDLKTDMPRAMVEEICRVRTKSGHPVWGWGGYYSNNKDAMHYELNCFPDQLATGIAPYPAQNNTSEEEDMTQDQANKLEQVWKVVAKSGYVEHIVQGVDNANTKLDNGGGGASAGSLSDADVQKIAKAVVKLIGSAG